MSKKGVPMSAEAKANMSSAQKARWAKINAAREYAAEHEAIHRAEPRCRQTAFQRFIAWFLGE